jgi:hypothetical protein
MYNIIQSWWLLATLIGWKQKQNKDLRSMRTHMSRRAYAHEQTRLLKKN